ncbi:hypothetical protein K1T71_005129 [Dendrolimus kikuchii]|uniref:Uncharacterized protein n=1 Tax=Dendrolimus kikuchii TaxID=765133 RepID=A0ACC1D6G3_9NEOP|nr:hypothetical protein K1T71_005129 [Dendrolimus kikuchii]
MPLSANFRREMLTAIKNAKKNKDKQDNADAEEGTAQSMPTEQGTLLAKPVVVSNRPSAEHSKDETTVSGGKSLKEKRSPTKPSDVTKTNRK